MSSQVPLSYPQTPKESMEFLSRLNWNLDISKALFHPSPQYLSGKGAPQNNMYRRLFSHKEEISSSDNKDERVNKKDKARVENAHTHSVVCVAGLAAAVAGAFFDHKSSEMSSALASATQLLASYCIEMAQQSGADRDRVASVVRSALSGSPTPTHLSTLTAGAATALRGEAALRARLPNNNNNKKRSSCSAAVSPHEKVAAYSQKNTIIDKEEEEDEEDLTCQGDLLQLTSKGMLRWRHVAVYINKAYQVTIKLKSKHVVVGGAFSKNNKCVVYEVIEKSEEWPFKRENNNKNMDNVYFGLKTSEGLLELKCNNNVHKQKWVDGIHKLLRRRRRFEQAENSLRMLHINNSI